MAPFFRHKKVIDRPRVFCYILRLRFHPKEHPLIGRNEAATDRLPWRVYACWKAYQETAS
jgi:hypothetical protein